MGNVYRINDSLNPQDPNTFTSNPENNDSNSADFYHEEKIPSSKKFLINKLNYLNFQEQPVLINLKHRDHDTLISKKAFPQPCIDDELFCSWEDFADINYAVQDYSLISLYVSDGRKTIYAEPAAKEITEKGILFSLPENCWEISSRKVRRNTCRGLNVQVIQEKVAFNGRLIDYSAVSFRVEITAVPPQEFSWLNKNQSVNVVFSNGNEVLFSGECAIIKEGFGKTAREFVLEPLSNQMSLFEPKEYRSMRQELVPQPNIVFKHPLTDKMTNLSVLDLSGTGFSVEEDFDNAVLLPGMIIPTIEICFANSIRFPCRAQVVYRKFIRTDGDISRIRFGFVILDMDINSHTEMSSILHQARNKNSYVCNQVDMDELWNFFFETGFVYPGKYKCIKSRKDDIKKTYERLYMQSPSIAKHFIYQNNGVILGHMSMLRFYSESWMIHHHAARKTSMVKAGLAVLQQIGRFTFDLHRINSGHMKYLFCYFRPENSFPAYVFGGATANMNNVQACSIDSFAYCHYRGDLNDVTSLPEEWKLEDYIKEDYHSLEDFYSVKSGGLMLQALDLNTESSGYSDLKDEFDHWGFMLERHSLALRKNNETVAIIVVNITDFALNLSDLTNAVSIIVLNEELMSEEIMAQLIKALYSRYNKVNIPLMIYPSSAGERKNLDYAKTYNLWVLKTAYSDYYFRIINDLLNITSY